jgi:hypothetical protein
MSQLFDSSVVLDILDLEASHDVLSELTSTELEKVRGGGSRGGSNIVVTGNGFGSPTIVISDGGKKGGSNIVVTYPSFPYPSFPYPSYYY